MRAGHAWHAEVMPGASEDGHVRKGYRAGTFTITTVSALEEIMMKVKHALSLLSLATCAAFSSAVFAQASGTVNFNGRILDVTCTPTLGGPSTVGDTVTLPPATIADLDTAGDVFGETEFTFEMTGCDVHPSTTQVWFHFGGANVDANGRLNPTSGTSKVRFELRDGLGSTTQIVAGGTAPGPNTAPGAGQGSSVGFTGINPNMDASKAYAVQYYAETGLVAGDGGNVTSSAVWTSVFY